MDRTLRKILYWILIAALLGVFLYSAYRLGAYFLEKRRSDLSLAEAEKYVHVTGESGLDKSEALEQVAVDFDALWELNDDVVAWLYGAGTHFNYPVMQSDDNEYYLRRLLDRTWNNNGSLFLDCRCSSDFSDGNSIIYGHNMKSGAMFSNLVKYKEQSYYEAHPYLYLTTPGQKYRVDLFAGCIIRSDADIYQRELTEEELAGYIAQSTFTPRFDTVPQGRVLTLSTCTYEFQNARYVVLGVLVPIA